MSAFIKIFSSSIGKKFVMAVTGLALVGFVIAHLLGNLQMFLGPEPINRYAKMLHDLGPLLWVARIGLIIFFLLHFFTGAKLRRENKKARPIQYEYNNKVQLSRASRIMLQTGVLISIFVLLHLAHFSLALLDERYESLKDSNGLKDVYRMVILGFSNYAFTAFYIFSMIVLGTHLSHGIGSTVQTLGWGSNEVRKNVSLGGFILGWGLAFGFMSIPIGVLLGIIK